jgi:lipoprotein signal peptidase
MLALLLLSEAGAFVGGQVASHLARREIGPAEHHRMKRLVDIRPVLNPRAVAAIVSPRTAVLLWVAMIAVLGGLLLLSQDGTGSLAALGTGFVVGGATSNLVDSVRHGGTVDYLVLGGRVVNLPDIAITVGLIALIVDVMI